MVNTLFLLVLGAGFGLLLFWGFKTLPGEKWQILAAMPVDRDESGRWRGVNLTYYGLLTAFAHAVAVAFLIILLGSLSVSLAGILAVAGVLLSLCVPAAALIARAVEKKPCTFTVGGAALVGFVIAPWVLESMNLVSGDAAGLHVSVIPALAALSVSYAFGEGTGRLACISFGCCYGKLLSESRPLVRRLFENRSFIFFGKTRKIAYASGMDGKKVIPVQAITSVLFIGAGLVGTFLFLQSRFTAALLFTVLVTQGWRAFSETLRADYRGEGRLSAYQFMALSSAVYVVVLPFLLPLAPSTAVPDLTAGLALIWAPVPLLAIQALAFFVFIHTGRSMVTGSTLSFHVIKERI